MSKPVVACPAEESCAAKLSLLAGTISSHLIDEHSYSQVGAKAAENVVRREASRVSTIVPAELAEGFIDHVLRKTSPDREFRVRRLCGICRQPGHRRETCPKRDMPQHARACRSMSADEGTVAGSPEKASPDDSPLLRVGRAIDLLREAAEELDQLVADGVIA